MSVEREFQPKRPFEMFGLAEKEQPYWRVSREHFQKIIEDDQAIVHSIRETSNN
jgi:hypothetical protein